MSDQEKRAQAAWANLGGLGPVPESLAVGEVPFGESGSRLLWAKRLIAERRHELRLRLIEAAVSGHAGRLSDPDASARLAVELADAVLARLEAEARGST